MCRPQPMVKETPDPMPDQRWILTLAYDGRPFSGWQSQPGGTGVQDAVEAALARVIKGGGGARLHGSGRTDAGVHALGQVAHFDCPVEAGPPDGAAWVRALNAVLPAQVRAMACRAAPPDFHARFSAAGKRYRYRICRADILPPLEAGLAWHLWGDLDLAALRAGAEHFRGEHDFARFAANRGPGSPPPQSTVRRITGVQVEESGDDLTIEFSGDGFLYKMVRLMVGALARVAMRRDGVGWLRGLIGDPRGGAHAYCAPADGLYLVAVEYPSPAAEGGA